MQFLYTRIHENLLSNLRFLHEWTRSEEAFHGDPNVSKIIISKFRDGGYGSQDLCFPGHKPLLLITFSSAPQS